MDKKNITNLQIAVDANLRKKAEILAREYGFNNLQDLIRVLLVSFTDKRVIPGIDLDGLQLEKGERHPDEATSEVRIDQSPTNIPFREEEIRIKSPDFDEDGKQEADEIIIARRLRF